MKQEESLAKTPVKESESQNHSKVESEGDKEESEAVVKETMDVQTSIDAEHVVSAIVGMTVGLTMYIDQQPRCICFFRQPH